VRCLFIHYYTSLHLFFHIVTFSVESLVYAGNPFLKTLLIEGGILTKQPCLHLMLDIIM